MSLEEERDSLRRELTGVTEMLAHVLSVAGTVTVNKEDLARGLAGKQIRIDEDFKTEAFVFSLVDVEVVE